MCVGGCGDVPERSLFHGRSSSNSPMGAFARTARRSYGRVSRERVSRTYHGRAHQESHDFRVELRVASCPAGLSSKICQKTPGVLPTLRLTWGPKVAGPFWDDSNRGVYQSRKFAAS